MELKTHGQAIDLRGGQARFSAEYTPGDGAAGVVVFRLEDQESFEAKQLCLRVDPWSADAFELYEYEAGQSLVICCARQIVSLDLESLSLRSVVGLEYEEGESIDRPWFVELAELGSLVVATERRVLCLDGSAAIRWIWSARSDSVERWITGSPKAVGRVIHVPVRTMRGDSVVALSADTGLPV